MNVNINILDYCCEFSQDEVPKIPQTIHYERMRLNYKAIVAGGNNFCVSSTHFYKHI